MEHFSDSAGGTGGTGGTGGGGGGDGILNLEPNESLLA